MTKNVLDILPCDMQRRLNNKQVQELLQVELPQVLRCYLLLQLSALLGGVAGDLLRPSLMYLVKTGTFSVFLGPFCVMPTSHMSDCLQSEDDVTMLEVFLSCVVK